MSQSQGCCSSSSSGNRSDASGVAELKLYRAFIFSVPIFFTLILLFLFYVFYLRPRRVDWSSIRMRSVSVLQHHHNNNATSTSDLGLKKELREMLPIIVYNESFSVKDTQCSVCLLDYQPEDRLQQIPACGHTFHMSCIDLWLSSHSTCPLCRLSLLPTAKSSTEISEMQATSNEEMEMQQSDEETLAMEFSDSRSTRHLETSVIQNVSGEAAIDDHRIEVEERNNH
ncbi:putative transcription factor C2H2 family [Medicago truncatula]|uniref:RING-type E3 ubiquitin transferase n=1 Tax=Medicago truncatula TaxID=3880 RepID=G7JKP9_MEDTR|nr:RING-H2 finger protein ATL58 isoform X1 [Medicago truncatula]AES87565.1 zinc finger, C3HC4 type (RING finger) protein [Medicago truncatula]RHN59463.1 putative transcription factor C2H2 family [Medicago truncatula]